MSKKQLQVFNGADNESKSLQLSETALKTRNALNKIVAQKLHDDKVTTLSNTSTNDGTTYVRYTSAQVANLTATDGKTAPKQRIIKITDQKSDPMLPSSFRIRKAPDGPPQDGFTPVMHDEASTQRLTKADQKKWQIAPSVSNWKNNKSFIIGIENRLQNSSTPNQLSEEDIERSTGRFTALSDALKNAEKQAKQDLKARADWRKRTEQEKLIQTQERLGKLAQEARISRKPQAGNTTGFTGSDDNLISDQKKLEIKDEHHDEHHNDPASTKLQRRAERRRRAEQELEVSKVSTKEKVRKLAREEGREVSERVVLGVTEALRKKQKETVYDSDLYLRTATSDNTDASDKLYDKPLFNHEAALNDVYRSRNISGYKGLGSNDETGSNTTSVNFVKDSKVKENEENE